MKVLWFTNTPCSYSKKLFPGLLSGGWMEALENQLNNIPGVELFVAFYHSAESDPVKYGNTTFYPVLREKGYLLELKKRALNQFHNDNTEIPRLLKVVEAINPDIIHIHGTEDNFGLIQKHVNQPVVISIQGIINPYFEKFYAGISKVDSVKNEPLKSRITLGTQFKSFRQFELMAKRESEILRMAKHVIGRTSWDKRVTSVMSDGKYYHGDELLREEFYNNIWRNSHVSQDEFKIVTTTSNSIYKGFETIIKTALILSRIKNFRFKWEIIGLSEDDSVVKIMVSWLKVNLPEINIVLRGKLAPQKFIPIMLQANVFCQVSHIENSPNSVCEAMCIGMPVIATFAGGTESMLENNREGILVQDGDPFSLAGTIFEISKNPEKAIIYGENARKRALVRHNAAKVSTDLNSLYQQIIRQ
jgi:glycosyltransferase involved in cell wall biosynthesis